MIAAENSECGGELITPHSLFKIPVQLLGGRIRVVDAVILTSRNEGEA